MRDRLRRWAPLLVAEALLLGPIAADLASGPRRVFAYLAGDAFYYLTVARNVADLGFPTFDQHHATNGFHPLWQGLLAGGFAIADTLGASDFVQLYLTVLASALWVGFSLWLLAAMVLRAEGRLNALFTLMPVGVYAVLIAPLWWAVGERLPSFNPFEGSAPLWGTLYHYANGMETGVLLAGFAAMGWLTVAGGPARSLGGATRLGLVMAWVTLARLDHGFFPACLGLGLWLCALRGGDVRGALRLMAGAAAGGALVGAYLLSNVYFFGHALPVSGSLKTTFPVPTLANAQSIAILLDGAPGPWLERASRATGLILPCVFALAELTFGPRARWRALRAFGEARFDFFLRMSCWGVWALALYNFCFVPPAHQGHWYFPVSTVLVSLIGLRWWSRLLRARAEPSRSIRGAGYAFIAVSTLLIFATLHRHADTHRRYASFMLEVAPALRARFHPEKPRLVEFDDGIVGYATGFPTMSASGLAADPEAARAVARGALLRLALRRGFGRYTSSIIGKARLLGALKRLRRDHRIEVEYLHPTLDVAVVRAEATAAAE